MSKKRTAVWLVAVVGMVLAGSIKADTVFQSDFTGITGAQISSLPEWSDGYVGSGATLTIDNNMGKLYGPGTGWVFSSIRADKSQGVAKNFDPINETGNRFECTIDSVDSTDTTYGAMFRMWVGPQSNATNRVVSTAGQHMWVDMTWNKSTNKVTLLLTLAVNTGSDNSGTTMYSFTQPTVDLDGGQHIRLALEVRDDPSGADVRAAYQIYKPDATGWRPWTYSDWFNPTDAAYGANAFDTAWKTGWDNNTYLYLEQNSRTSYPRSVFVDDVLVTGTLPEPATIGLLIAGGAITLLRKRRV